MASAQIRAQTAEAGVPKVEVNVDFQSVLIGAVPGKPW